MNKEKAKALGATHYKGRRYYKFDDYYGKWFKLKSSGRFEIMFNFPIFRLRSF